MTPRTDIRLQINIATVQLQPVEMDEADLKAPPAEFLRMQHGNDRAREGKLYIHKADCIEERKSGEILRGAMQSAMFDIDKSNGRRELSELMDFIKDMTIEHLYAPQEGAIITGE